jgi:hypothetical protein
MPRIGFVCPDGVTVSFEECFTQCRLGERCAPLPYLRGMAIRRKVEGHTVTELAEPTRHIMLKKTTDYYESPDTIDFAFRGSSHHFVLDRNAGVDVLNEERDRLNLGGGRIITGAFDYYDPAARALEDYKMWGAYKVRKALDEIAASGSLRFMLNEEGEPVYTDWLGVVFQQNCYRLILERAGFPVESITLWAYVRDHNWYAVQKLGLERKWYRLPVHREPDELVLAHARDKYDKLEAAIRSGFAPRCSDAETWGGKRCADFCPVRSACDALDTAAARPRC